MLPGFQVENDLHALRARWKEGLVGDNEVLAPFQEGIQVRVLVALLRWRDGEETLNRCWPRQALQRVMGCDTLVVSQAMMDLGDVLLVQGAPPFDEALKMFTKAEEQINATCGPLHPLAARAQASLAKVVHSSAASARMRAAP